MKYIPDVKNGGEGGSWLTSSSRMLTWGIFCRPFPHSPSYLSTVVAAAHQVMQSEAKCTNPCHPLTFLPGYCTPDVRPQLSVCELSPGLFLTPFIPAPNWTSPRRPPHPSAPGFRVSESKGRELSPPPHPRCVPKIYTLSVWACLRNSRPHGVCSQGVYSEPEVY